MACAGGDARIVLEQHADGLGEALAQIAGDLDLVAEDRVAVGLDQHHVALGEHLAGALVVADLVGQQPTLAGADLDVAGGGDRAGCSMS